MGILWLALIFIVFGCVALNIYASRQIQSSEQFTDVQKKYQRIVIWLIPFSAFLSLAVMNQSGRVAMSRSYQQNSAGAWEFVEVANSVGFSSVHSHHGHSHDHSNCSHDAGHSSDCSSH